MAETAAMGTLSGVRVLDLADETAVLGTKLLSDLGADVLRIEPPGGDPIRRLGPFVSPKSKVQSPKSGDGQRSASLLSEPGPATLDSSLSHWWYNSGKRSAVIDWESAAGRDRILHLAADADIVIETGIPGLDFVGVREAYPALTVVSVRGLGATGPRAGWEVTDLVAWALGGAMYSTGLADRPPLRANWALASQIAGLYAAIGALAGLYQARATGSGAHFDLSRVESVANLLPTHIPIYFCDKGRLESRVGLENPLIAPFRAFATRDGQVSFLAVTQGQWNTLVEWLIEADHVEPWLVDPDLAPLAARMPHRDRIHAWLEPWIAGFDTDYFVREANRRRIPCAPLNPPHGVLRDEQLRARGFFVQVDHPLLGRTVEYPGLPYQFPGNGSVRPAPERVSVVGGQVSWLPRTEDGTTSAESDRKGGGAGLADPRPPTPDPRRRSDTRHHSGPDTPPLAGLRVLDLTWALAGPTGTRALADLGADLVKIEPFGVGEVMRGIPPFPGGQPNPNTGGLFLRVGVNRRNLSVDLKKPAGVDLVKRLAAWADVVIDNFGAGVMSRLGLGPETLRSVKPDLIQFSLSGYGQEGPTCRYPSFAPISESRSGLSYATSYADGTPAGPSIFIGDTGAGLQLAAVTLAVIERRRRTGEGAYIDMSQFEAATVLLGPALLEAAINGTSFTPRGNLLPDRDAAPHGAYPAAPADPAESDRWVVIACLTEDHWQNLLKLMERPDLAEDARFRTAADRVAHVDALDAIVGEWTRTIEAHDLADRLQRAGVPAGVVQTARDLLEKDPQLAARGFFQTVHHPEAGPIPIDTSPLRWSDGSVPIRYPSPLVGEHNEYVLREILGLSEEEIVDLIVEEVV